MTEIKDKIITLESLAMVHAYNQNAYMSKTNNVLVLMDLDDKSLQYNPSDFVNFILEIVNANNEIEQIVFTNKIVNNETFNVKAQTSFLDENGDVLLYELYFYLENNKYKTDLKLTKISLLTGIKEFLDISYTKLYGIKIA